MFSGASNFANDVDRTFLFIIIISLIFLIGISTLLIYFAIRYNRKRHPVAVQVKDNITLEVTWTAVAIALVLLMFYYGYTAYLPQRKIPEDALPVKVISRMWSWSFDYGQNRVVADTLVVPVNKPIRLDMISVDVTHSLYIPAFRIKEDVVPGMTTQMWFIGEREGSYEILCAEFCGLRHSYMQGRVKVVSEEEYNAWLVSLDSLKDQGVHPGLALLKLQGCLACHSLDGTKLVGPTFKNLYNAKYVVLSGDIEKTIKADSTYIRNSVYNPNENIVKGYNKGLMQSYTGIISESQMSDILKYLQTISVN